MMGYNDKESNSHLQAVSAPSTDLHHSRSLCRSFFATEERFRSAIWRKNLCSPHNRKSDIVGSDNMKCENKKQTTFLSKAFPSAPCSQAFIWLRCCWSVCPTVEMLCSSVRVCARSSALCVSWICARTPHTPRAPPLLLSSCYL